MTITYDLRYLEAGISVLKDYLLSKELFWPVDAATLTLRGRFFPWALKSLSQAWERDAGRLVSRGGTGKSNLGRRAWEDFARRQGPGCYNVNQPR